MSRKERGSFHALASAALVSAPRSHLQIALLLAAAARAGGRTLPSAEALLHYHLALQEPEGLIPSPAAVRKGHDPIGTPLLAWAANQLRQAPGVSPDLGARIYPALCAHVGWMRERRLFADELGLFAWRGRAEWDASLRRFDGRLDFCSPDLSAFLASEMDALASMADALGRPVEASVWRERRIEVEEGLNYHLWDDDEGWYDDTGWAGDHRKQAGPAAWLPLFAGIVPEPRARRLIDRLGCPPALRRHQAVLISEGLNRYAAPDAAARILRSAGIAG